MTKHKKKIAYKILWAFIWIAVGILWMLSNYGKLPFSFTWANDWPVIFIIIGLISFFNISINYSSDSKKKRNNLSEKIDIEKKNKQILDAVENNEMSAMEAAKKLKDISEGL